MPPTAHQVTIYSTPTCHFCHAAKEFFAANGIVFTEHNVASDLEQRKAMIDRSGQMGVPVILVDDQLIVGFDEKRLRQALHIQAA